MRGKLLEQRGGVRAARGQATRAPRARECRPRRSRLAPTSKEALWGRRREGGHRGGGAIPTHPPPTQHAFNTQHTITCVFRSRLCLSLWLRVCVLFPPMQTGDSEPAEAAAPHRRRVRVVEPNKKALEAWPRPPSSSSSGSTSSSARGYDPASMHLHSLYGCPAPQPPRASSPRTMATRASGPRAAAVRVRQEAQKPVQWQRRQMFNLPVSEVIVGCAAHVRATPKARPRTAPPLPRPQPVWNQEAALDELWNLQVSQMEFKRLLDEEREYEAAELELEAKIKAVKRSLLLQQLKHRYHSRQPIGVLNQPRQEAMQRQMNSSVGSASPRHREAPHRGARHTRVGLPWSHAGAQILQTERSLLEAGWSRQAVDEHLQQLFACR